MGMFDEFVGWSKCSKCKELNEVGIQFKWLDCMLTRYSVGDYVDGHQPFTIFSEDDTYCKHCGKEYVSYVIGKMGYLYGFCNEEELAKIKEFISFKEEEFVTFTISKELLQKDPDKAMKQIKAMYEANPGQESFVLINMQDEKEKMDALVCRIPSFVKEPKARPTIGDTYYYDDRSDFYELWDFQDEVTTILDRTFHEEGQYFLYKIQFPSGEIRENVHEKQLVNEQDRDSMIETIQKAKQEILDYFEWKQKEADGLLDDKERKMKAFNEFRVCHHYQRIIEQMKERGELESDIN